MTGLITKAALLSACGMLVAAVAMAGIADPASCQLQSAAGVAMPGEGHFLLVSTTLGAPDSVSGKFLVLVRDVALNPVVGSNVVIDLSGCTADLKIASSQQNVNYTVNCTAKTVSAFTNAAGIAAFTILGTSFNSPAPLSFSPINAGKVYADGRLIKHPTVAAADLSGSGGISGSDISIWLGDLAAYSSSVLNYRARADFDGGGTISGGDASLWLAVLARNSVVTASGVPSCTP